MLAMSSSSAMTSWLFDAGASVALIVAIFNSVSGTRVTQAYGSVELSTIGEDPQFSVYFFMQG